MQLAVEGLQVPDVRDAEEEDVAAFNNFLDKAYRLWLARRPWLKFSDLAIP